MSFEGLGMTTDEIESETEEEMPDTERFVTWKPGDRVQVYSVWAAAPGGPHRAWFSGYEYVREDDGCAVLRITTGTFAGVTVRYAHESVRLDETVPA